MMHRNLPLTPLSELAKTHDLDVGKDAIEVNLSQQADALSKSIESELKEMVCAFCVCACAFLCFCAQSKQFEQLQDTVQSVASASEAIARAGDERAKTPLFRSCLLHQYGLHFSLSFCFCALFRLWSFVFCVFNGA